MSKTYKQYCKEAYKRDPKTYGIYVNPDGTLKPPPKTTNMFKTEKTSPPKIKIDNNEPIKKSKPIKSKPKRKPKIEIKGKEIKINGMKMNLELLDIPEGLDRKEYNRRWMNNNRVKKRIKRLKNKYGITKPL